jgi:Zn-finger nucleic acid-binding protein
MSGYRCPECHVLLVASPLTSGVAWACRTCAGVGVSVAVLRQHAHHVVQTLWAGAFAASRASARPCPSCAQPLRTFDAGQLDDPLELDACTRCLMFWFDAKELEQARVSLPEPRHSADVAQARALMDSRVLHEDARFVTAAEFARHLMAEVAWYFRSGW